MSFSWNPVSLRVRIVSANREYCRPEWRWVHPGGKIAWFNLWLVAQGRGTMKLADDEMSLCAGDCLLLRLWRPNDGTHDPKHPLVVPYVVFELLDRRGRPLENPPDASLPALHRRVDPMGFFAILLQRCIDAHQAGDDSAAAAWLRSGLMELARQDALPTSASPQHEQMTRIETLCEDIRRDPAKAPRGEELAEKLGYSVDHFIRLFRKFKGVTPGEFIIQSRLQTACQMLRFSSLSITQIAGQLGYGDIYAFSKQFRQRMGTCPSAFRHNQTPYSE
jgi:AraC family transcriptional regulator of arabinose operon